MTASEALRHYFGYDSFREGQQSLVEAILSGRDALAIMPTGAGKSLCYQLPALLLPGVTLVISPLISLMQDQVKALNGLGIRAAYINSSLSAGQTERALDNAARGEYKIIYVAPERLENPYFLRFARTAEISMVTVDEAHCISQWGQDFRPGYLKITDFVESLPKRPIVSAFTATATPEVKNDIQCILKLQYPAVSMTGFDRPNLYFQVERVKDKKKYITAYLRSHSGDSGIIYCATRKNTDELCELLQMGGVSAVKYHAGMTNTERKRNQEDFVYDRVPVVVATNAFGMGIDKSNVRFVIHYNMPQSMENYYQEAGRAGRDGVDSRCILLYSPQDVIIQKFLLENKVFEDVSPEDEATLRERDLLRLRSMEGYCKTGGCLRSYILRYFGEAPLMDCGSCGNCDSSFREVDLIREARSVVNCVAETRGRYGITMIRGILTGANTARLREIGAERLKTYGALRETGTEQLTLLMDRMLEEGILRRTEDTYAVLRLGDITALKGENAVFSVRLSERRTEDTAKKRQGKDQLTAAGYRLFDALRATRQALASENAVAPYMVFSDRTLIEMCVSTPTDRYGLLRVSGVGELKLEKYGARFIETICGFLQENPGAVFRTEGETAETQETPRARREKKQDFRFTAEDAERYEFAEKRRGGEIKEEIIRILGPRNIRPVTVKEIQELLLRMGLIAPEQQGKLTVYRPTERGKESGISLAARVSRNGTEYEDLQYDERAQQLILDALVNA